MAKAIIVLEDHGDGVAVTMSFEGGFKVDSHAHQQANILLKSMDEQDGAVKMDETFTPMEQPTAKPTLVYDAAAKVIAAAKAL